jgi:hypothetical protein
MPDFLEYDFDNPAHRRRSRPQVEIMEPDDEPRRAHHVEITIRRQRPGIQRVIVTAAMIVLALILIRSGPAAVLMLSALIGLKAIGAAAVTLIIVALIAWREHRAGRSF